jgi:hypothetical protein
MERLILQSLSINEAKVIALMRGAMLCEVCMKITSCPCPEHALPKSISEGDMIRLDQIAKWK